MGKYFSIHKLYCWTQDVSHFSPYHTYLCRSSDQYWLLNFSWCHKSSSQARLLKSDFQWAKIKLLWADECENGLLVPKTTCTSFCTVTLKHLTLETRRKTSNYYLHHEFRNRNTDANKEICFHKENVVEMAHVHSLGRWGSDILRKKQTFDALVDAAVFLFFLKMQRLISCSVFFCVGGKMRKKN